MYGFTLFNTLDNLLKDELEFANNFSPLTNQHVTKTEDAWIFELALPGYSKKDIKVEAVGKVLTIEATIAKENESYFKKSFKKTYSLPGQVDAKDIKADMENGLLTLTLGKHETAKKVTIL